MVAQNEGDFNDRRHTWRHIDIIWEYIPIIPLYGDILKTWGISMIADGFLDSDFSIKHTEELGWDAIVRE